MKVLKRPKNAYFWFVVVGYMLVDPLNDMRDAAAAAAVGTTPVETPGFAKCSSLKQIYLLNLKRNLDINR